MMKLVASPMTAVLYLWLTSSALPAVVAASVQTEEEERHVHVVNVKNNKHDFASHLQTLPSCTHFPDTGIPLFHQDKVCDLEWENSAQWRKFRKYHNEGFAGAEFLQRVPEERTWQCPSNQDLAINLLAASSSSSQDGQQQQAPPPMVGQDTRWVVENQSKGPIVLAYLQQDNNDNDGGNNDGIAKEVSAYNAAISPPHDDPNAIVMPGQFKSIRVFQGHVFYARELKVDEAGQYVPGRILVQHRAGLRAIRNRRNVDLAAYCSSNKDDDVPEPLLEEFVDADPEDLPPNPERMFEALEENFRRTPTAMQERCNAIYVGFLNKLPCPVDLYYAGTTVYEAAAAAAAGKSSSSSTGPSSSSSTTTTATSSSASLLEDNNDQDPPTCREEFKFHLGLNYAPQDYMYDWDSPAKFETSYISHTWVARLSNHPHVVVDRFVMDRTVVTDCPEESSKVGIPVSSLGVPIPVGGRYGNPTNETDNTDDEAHHLYLEIELNHTTTKQAAAVGRQRQNNVWSPWWHQLADKNRTRTVLRPTVMMSA